MFRGVFRNVEKRDEYTWEKFKLTEYTYDDGAQEYTLTADCFTYLPLNREQLEDLHTFLATLHEDEVI